jgi:mannose-6-phosphate isomerase-like protein (cupin superfamily)
MSYIVRRFDEVPEEKIICGVVRELTTKDDNLDSNVSVVRVLTETKKHHHNKLTEYYYVLEGAIKVILDDEHKELLRKGDVIMIRPGTCHKAVAMGGKECVLLVLASPAFDRADEIEDE